MGEMYYVFGVIGVGLLTVAWLLFCFRKWLKLRAELAPETVFPAAPAGSAREPVAAAAKPEPRKLAA